MCTANNFFSVGNGKRRDHKGEVHNCLPHQGRFCHARRINEGLEQMNRGDPDNRRCELDL